MPAANQTLTTWHRSESTGNPRSTQNHHRQTQSAHSARGGSLPMSGPPVNLSWRKPNGASHPTTPGVVPPKPVILPSLRREPGSSSSEPYQAIEKRIALELAIDEKFKSLNIENSWVDETEELDFSQNPFRKEHAQADRISTETRLVNPPPMDSVPSGCTDQMTMMRNPIQVEQGNDNVTCTGETYVIVRLCPKSEPIKVNLRNNRFCKDSKRIPNKDHTNEAWAGCGMTDKLRNRILGLHGVFAMIKPGGETSAAAVERVKRAILSNLPSATSGQSKKEIRNKLKVGHGGTLDPIATGVLVIGLGAGCKMMQSFLKGTNKVYHSTIVLGTAFDTYDRTGVVTAQRSWDHVTEDMIRVVLKEKFLGAIKQRPPAFSALHVNGERAYDLARKRQKLMSASVPAGVDMTNNEAVPDEIQLPEREVTIYKCDLLSFDSPILEIVVECSSGTYIRSIANDLGLALGTVAHMKELERTTQGRFTLESAIEVVGSTIDLDQLEQVLEKQKS